MVYRNVSHVGLEVIQDCQKSIEVSFKNQNGIDMLKMVKEQK